MIERIRIQKILQTLSEYRDHSLLESAIQDQINLVLPRPISTVEFHESLSFCRDKGFIDFRIDDYKEKRWFITEPGIVHMMRG